MTAFIEKKVEELVRDITRGGFMTESEARTRVTALSQEALLKGLEVGENRGLDRLEKLKRAWDDVVKNGNPNEKVETQIFGFMQAYDVVKEGFAALKKEVMEGTV